MRKKVWAVVAVVGLMLSGCAVSPEDAYLEKLRASLPGVDQVDRGDALQSGYSACTLMESMAPHEAILFLSQRGVAVVVASSVVYAAEDTLCR